MKVLIDNLEIAYTRSGRGKVLLLLHGWGTSKENFGDLAESLASSFDVISMDFPGFGESQMPPEAWGVKEYVQLVSQFLEKLNVNQVYAVIGHSFGARVIIRGVATNMLTPSKVVLLGAAGIKPKATLRTHTYKTAAKLGKPVMSLPLLRKRSDDVRSRLYQNAGASDYLATSGVMRQTFLRTIEEDLSEMAKQVTCPVLLIWGSEDKDTPLRNARQFAAAMPNAELKIIQEAGHFVHNDGARKVYRWVDSFLQ